jgi:hypothetical protein
MSDPNWLLSTAAQSAAALIAIIGGFLVSRVVAISSEKAGRTRQEGELRRRKKMAESERSSLLDSIEKNGVFLFAQHHIEKIAATRERTHTEELVRDYVPPGISQFRMIEMARPILDLAAQAFSDINQTFSDATFPPENLEGLRASGLQIDTPLERIIYLEIAINIAASRRPQWPATPEVRALTSVIPYIPRMPTPREEQQRVNVTRAKDLDSEIGSLENQINTVAWEITLLGKPTGITQGIWVLGIFGCSGILLPMYLMSGRPLVDTPGIRTLAVAGFAFGLLLLMGYLIWSVGRLVVCRTHFWR